MLSLSLTGVLIVRIIAIDNLGAFVILVPAFAGGLLAIWRPGPSALIASALLTTVTAVVSLIGGVGLLYIPSIVLFIRGALTSERQAGGAGAIGHAADASAGEAGRGRLPDDDHG